MKLDTVSWVALALLGFHVVTIVVIRAFNGDIFRPKAPIDEVMSRLAVERPITHRVYQASLLLPLLELGAVVLVKFGSAWRG